MLNYGVPEDEIIPEPPRAAVVKKDKKEKKAKKKKSKIEKALSIKKKKTKSSGDEIKSQAQINEEIRL